MELSDREIAHNHRNGSFVSQFDGILSKKKTKKKPKKNGKAISQKMHNVFDFL